MHFIVYIPVFDFKKLPFQITLRPLRLVRIPNKPKTTYELTFRPKLCKQITTEFRFCLSHKSTVWKVSWAGTPNCLAASRNALMFSIHLNAMVVWLIFFTEPGWIELANLKMEKKIGN